MKGATIMIIILSMLLLLIASAFIWNYLRSSRSLGSDDPISLRWSYSQEPMLKPYVLEIVLKYTFILLILQWRPKVPRGSLRIEPVLMTIYSFFCRKKFKGISRRPSFCRTIYQSFKNQQSNSAAIVNTGEDLQGEEKIVALFLLLVYIFSCESSSLSDNVRLSVGWSVGLSIINEFQSSM